MNALVNHWLRRTVTGCLIAVFLVSGLTACSTATYRKGIVETEKTVYTAQSPGRNWTRIETDKSDLIFWNKQLDAFIMVNSTCDEYRDAPVAALHKHLFFGIEKKEILTEREVTIDGRQSLYSEVSGMLDGAPIKVAAYTLVKNYCTYDLSFTAPPDQFDSGIAALHRVSGQFHVIKRKK